MQSLLMETQLSLMNVAMDWSIETFLVNLRDKLKIWGSGAIMVLGVVMIIAAVIQIGKGFIMGARAQTSWGMAAACLIIGGMLLAGGWNIVGQISTGAGSSLTKLGDTKKGQSELSKYGDSSDKATTETTATTAPVQ